MQLLQQINKISDYLDRQSSIKTKIHLRVTKERDFIFNLNNGVVKTYKPTAFFKRYIDDHDFVSLVMGPYSSGKSNGLIMHKLWETINMPVCKDGVRRARTIMTRTTLPKLQSSTIKSFMAWFAEFGDPIKGKQQTCFEKPAKYHSQFNFEIENQDGSITTGSADWEVMFMAFEKEADVDKLGSIEFTNGFVNETRDFPKILFDLIQGRIGRYPMVEDLGTNEYKHSLGCDTNAPTKTHWIKETFDKDLTGTGYKFFRQQPAVIKNPEGKWIENPIVENPYNTKGYYLKFIANKTEEFINVYARGEWGMVFEGQPVYPEYNDDFHSVEFIDYTPKCPLYLGWDFGLTPSLIVSQYIDGQWRAIKEFVSTNFGILNLIESDVKPYWSLNNLYDYEIASSDADPAGNARSAKDIDEPTLIQAICESFCDTRAAITNNEDVRTESVRNFLNRNVRGKPAFILSRSGCPVLREGFNGEYHYKEKTVAGSVNKVPTKTIEKKHPHSDIHDGLQYTALRLTANGPIDNNLTDNMRRVIKGGHIRL